MGKTSGPRWSERYPPQTQWGPDSQSRCPGGHVAKSSNPLAEAPAVAPHPAPTPYLLTPHGNLLAKHFALTSEVQPEGRRLASSIIASIMSEWFRVCYLHCSLGEKTSLPTEVLQFLLFIQDYTCNPIIKHRSCPESRVIAYRCAQP